VSLREVPAVYRVIAVVLACWEVTGSEAMGLKRPLSQRILKRAFRRFRGRERRMGNFMNEMNIAGFVGRIFEGISIG
jgi:hypothetical protein